MNSRPAARGSQEARFTQSRDHSFAQPSPVHSRRQHGFHHGRILHLGISVSTPGEIEDGVAVAFFSLRTDSESPHFPALILFGRRKGLFFSTAAEQLRLLSGEVESIAGIAPAAFPFHLHLLLVLCLTATAAAPGIWGKVLEMSSLPIKH